MTPKYTRQLKWGASGDDVDLVHGWLAEIFYFWKDKTPVPTGKLYSFTTKKAVENFQRRQNLPVTGVVDKRTWDTMDYCMGYAVKSYS